VNRILPRLAVWVVCGCSVLAWAQQPSADDLKKQRADAEAKLKEVNAKISAARLAVEKQDDVAKLARDANAARKATTQKAATDPKAVEARQAAVNAAAAVVKTANEEVAASPDYQAIKKDLADQAASVDELESQQRIAGFILGEVHRKVGKEPDLAKLAQTAEVAATAARGKPADSVEAKTAADARKALNETTKAKVSANAQGAEQLKKLEEIAGKLKAAHDARIAGQAKLADARKATLAKSEKYAAASKAAETSAAEARKTTEEQTKAERETFDKAQKAYNEALSAKVKADPAITQLRKDAEDLQAKIRELSAEIRKLEPPATKPK